MAQLISTYSEGSISKLKENGALVDFYVAKHDYEPELNGSGRTLFVRKDCYLSDSWSGGKNTYATGFLDKYMNSDYSARFDQATLALMGTTKFRFTPGNGEWDLSTLERKFFSLSLTELGKSHRDANVEGSPLSIAKQLEIAYMDGDAVDQFTRSPETDNINYVWRVTSSGGINTEVALRSGGHRPCFTLPAQCIIYDDGTVALKPDAPAALSTPTTAMQGGNVTITWSAVVGVDSYVLERKADSGEWEQIYSGAELTFSETIGTWNVVVWRVKAVKDGVSSDYTTSETVKIVPASACTISGEDGDLGTLTGDIVYTAMTSTSEPITVTETVNGTVLRTFQPVSGAQQRISVMDLPTGGGTAVIQAECSGVSVTRTWTYTKAAADFPAAPTPFDIALLSKGGRVQFPQTLAECVRMPGGTMLDRYTQHWWKRRTILQEIEIANSYAAVDLSDQPSTTAGVTISYSESAHVDAATNRIELDHPTTVDVSYSKYTNANVLAGKYFKNPVHDEIRYVEPGTQATRSSRDYSGSSSGKMYKVTIQTKATSIATEIGDWEYLQSNDRGAYPDSGISGGYEYQYLGQPFGLDNLLGGTKIATGSYTGTGKYGSDNPNTLTLDFVPQLILIFWAHSGGNAPNAIAWLGKDMGFSYKPAGSNGQWYYTYPITVLPPNGTDMRWYSPADVSAQMNGSGVEYRYFAIG